MASLTQARYVLCLTLALPAWACQDAAGKPAPQSEGSAEASQSTGQDAAPPAASKDAPAKADNAAANTSDQPAEQSTTTKPPPRKRRVRGRKQAEVLSPGETRRVVIHRGGVAEPATQIIPGMSAEESNRERQETQDLLGAVDSDLKKLATRPLNSNQQETVSQIQHYTNVARSALQEGDIQRAHTLARKAQLLSDDLVKH